MSVFRDLQTNNRRNNTDGLQSGGPLDSSRIQDGESTQESEPESHSV